MGSLCQWPSHQGATSLQVEPRLGGIRYNASLVTNYVYKLLI